MKEKCDREHVDFPVLNVINAAKAWSRGVDRETADEHLRPDEKRLYLMVQALLRHEKRARQPELAKNVLPFEHPRKGR